MKNEKEASVLSTSNFNSADDLTMYNDKAIKAKKQNINKKLFNKKPSYIESLSDSKMNQFGPISISYDLNTLDIDLTLRSNSIASEAESLEYDASSERFQALDTQYEFDCNYAKSSSEIHAVADMILKRKKMIL